MSIVGSRPRIVIWCASGHALVVADALRRSGDFEVIGFLDELHPERSCEGFGGGKILGGRESLPQLRAEGILHIALAFGHCSARRALGVSLLEQGFQLPAIVHPTASIGERVMIGEGAFIGAGAILDPECVVGRFAIINSGAIICHNSMVADAVHVCPGSRLGGWTRVGAESWIGIGTSIRDRITIGRGSYVGAGSVVVHDLPEQVLAYGTPARVVKPITESF